MNSKYFTFIFLICAISAAASTILNSSSFYLRESISPKISIENVEDFSKSREVTVNIKAFGNIYSTKLSKPSSRIFSSNFNLHLTKEDKNGGIYFEEATPSKREMELIQDTHFVDSETDSVFSLNHVNGKAKLRGIIGNISIVPNEEDHIATPLDFDKSILKSQLGNIDHPPFEFNFTDKYDWASNFSTRANFKTKSKIELYVVFDYDNYLAHGRDRAAILDYLAVFFHAVNNRYASIPDLDISFRIVGVLIVTTRAGQPYLESSKTPNRQAFDIEASNIKFSKWIYEKMKTLPKFDLAAVISGSKYQYKGTDGNFHYGTLGTAYYAEACKLNKVKKQFGGTSVSVDEGGYYQGVWTVAHELAHNIGAPHDGVPFAPLCPWDDGYIMSYQGWGYPNKFKFSRCSINMMKAYITSKAGICLRTTQNIKPGNDLLISKDLPGDRIDINKLCEDKAKYMISMGYKFNVKDGRVYYPENPSDFCMSVKCTFPGLKWISWTNKPAPDNTPCGKHGKCRNGVCIS